MGVTFSPASHLLEADEIVLLYPLFFGFEELSVINQWRQNLKGSKRFSGHLELSGRRRKILRLMSWDLNPEHGPAYFCFEELRLNRERGNMPRVFYKPVDIDPVLIDPNDFQACMQRLKSDLEDFEEDCGKKNHTQALLNLINRLAVIIRNTEEALRDLWKRRWTQTRRLTKLGLKSSSTEICEVRPG